MVSKNLPDWYQNCTTSQIFIFGEYLQGELLFGSLSSETILILGRLDLSMKVLAWFLDLNGVEIKSTHVLLVSKNVKYSL